MFCAISFWHDRKINFLFCTHIYSVSYKNVLSKGVIEWKKTLGNSARDEGFPFQLDLHNYLVIIFCSRHFFSYFLRQLFCILPFMLFFTQNLLVNVENNERNTKSLFPFSLILNSVFEITGFYISDKVVYIVPFFQGNNVFFHKIISLLSFKNMAFVFSYDIFIHLFCLLDLGVMLVGAQDILLILCSGLLLMGLCELYGVLGLSLGQMQAECRHLYISPIPFFFGLCLFLWKTCMKSGLLFLFCLGLDNQDLA